MNTRRFFPFFVDISGKTALIIGGGNIALRRVRTLLQFGCRIHIIAEKIHDDLEALAKEYAAQLTLERRVFRSGDCLALPEKRGRAFFVVAATCSRETNRAVAAECIAHNIPVSAADCKEDSTFYFPATAIHGTIVAGISSGGNDHGAVRTAAEKIRKVLENNDDTNRQPRQQPCDGTGADNCGSASCARQKH